MPLGHTLRKLRPTRLARARGAALLRLAACFLTMTMVTTVARAMERIDNSGNLFWIANGILLAYILLAPRWRWPLYLGAGLAGISLGSALSGEPFREWIYFDPLNLVEILVGAVLLRARSSRLPRFTDPLYLLRFLLFAAFLGPLAAALA